MSPQPAALRAVFVAVLMSAAGCSAYVTPGGPAELSALGVAAKPDKRRDLTDPFVQSQLDLKPLAKFPTALAVARVQAPGYRSSTADGWGCGRYSVVFTRDVEKDEHFQRLAKLPRVNGVAPINRLLLVEDLQTDKELRTAAAALQAEVLMIYTLNTVTELDDRIPPLTVLTLGLLPDLEARVRTTASAVLLDTRNGYIYGAGEATAKHNQTTNAWVGGQALEDSRRKTESESFEKLVGEMERVWVGVAARQGEKIEVR